MHIVYMYILHIIFLIISLETTRQARGKVDILCVCCDFVRCVCGLCCVCVCCVFVVFLCVLSALCVWVVFLFCVCIYV